MILLAQGETERGVELLQRAFGEQPQDPEVRYHLAQGLADQGNATQAVSLLRELLADPKTQFSERPQAEDLLARLTGD